MRHCLLLGVDMDGSNHNFPQTSVFVTSVEQIAQEISDYLTIGMHHSTSEGKAALTRIITRSLSNNWTEQDFLNMSSTNAFKRWEAHLKRNQL